jgi:hypothetical protein
VEYLVKFDTKPQPDRVKGDAATLAAKAVELANLVGETHIGFPYWVTGKQVVLTIPAGLDVDFVEQQILKEASTIPGVYGELIVSLSNR